MYLIVKDRQGIIIDPGFTEVDAEQVITKIKTECLKVPVVFLTHAHYDHISGCQIMQREFKSKIYCHKFEKEKLADGQKSGALLFPAAENPKVANVEYLVGGEEFDLLGLKMKIMHTPGHSRGGISILLENKVLFSGDTIFKGSIGRTDFDDGSYEEEISSIKNKILCLAPETIIYPGHMGPTTVQAELRNFR